MTGSDAWDDREDQFGSDGHEQGDDIWGTDVAAVGQTFSMAGLDDEPDWPQWMGLRWDQIQQEDRREAFIALRRWVDWFVAEYEVSTQYIKPCWFEHSDVRAELYGAMLAETKTWAEPGPGFTALTMWHPHVHQLLARLKFMATGCVNGHVPVEANPLQYDEDRWAAIIESTQSVVDVPRGNDGTLLRVLAAHKTREADETRPVQIAAAKKAPTAILRPLETASLADPNVVQVRAFIEGGHARLSWQRSEDGGSTWMDIEPPDAEASPYPR